MRFLVILATGASLCLFLFLNGLPGYGMTAIIGTFILFFASAAVKKKLKLRNPQLVFQLEVRPTFGSAFPLKVEKTIPYILLPQFQPGKVFTINYDPFEPGMMGFLNYRTAEGAIIDLADYTI